MLKKAGIIVAAAAAGLLAVSPLAFASDHGDWDHDGNTAVNSVEDDGDNNGFVNVADNEANVPVQVCNNDVPVNVAGIQVSDVQADLTGALGALFGEADADDDGGAGDVRECSQENSSGGEVVQNIG
ncbi:hypothetical protein GCM10017691_05700 [Pseudonocardia petroleophila]|uniref:Secreted protein n=1 Tax=Pseudonocardia petroleophila TaxID=37331 RepID=A0A7G7MK70_9PSEU|nr:hypothetical protein [Pseudonocardia petroleophila]QNG53181.1 hypothetical protein H6H00_03985 [Pseudonocardia petroleophila]